jgi:hypothetical protein
MNIQQCHLSDFCYEKDLFCHQKMQDEPKEKDKAQILKITKGTFKLHDFEKQNQQH